MAKQKSSFLTWAIIAVLVIAAFLYYRGDIGPGRAMSMPSVTMPSMPSGYQPVTPRAPQTPTLPISTAQFATKSELNQLANTVNSFNSRISALETRVAGIENKLLSANCCVPLGDPDDPIISFACAKQSITSETCMSIPDCKWIC